MERGKNWKILSSIYHPLSSSSHRGIVANPSRPKPLSQGVKDKTPKNLHSETHPDFFRLEFFEANADREKIFVGKRGEHQDLVKIWREKIEGNRKRDRNSAKALRSLGWQVLVIWECAAEKTTSKCAISLAGQ
jgi:hypothetical protein